MRKSLKDILTSPVMWPLAGSILLYALICFVSGGVNMSVITAGLKLSVFAMLL
ncbi:MAG: hypothetical protein IJQ58_10145 [Synergistaceae bacterium]|nr:hypothetical protein [Synergistaceae bacterium]